MIENQTDDVPFLSNVGIMMTYKCTIACPHCIVQAGPSRTEEMALESTLAWLDQIKAYRNGFVCGISLTGGEPFYNLEHLIKVADYSRKLGFITTVVSNAYWATSKQVALSVLSKCDSIQMISISTDLSHQKFIPLEYVKNAIWAAKKLKKLYNIAVATESENSPEYLNLVDDILDFADVDSINTSIILPVGRAEKEIDPNLFNYSSTPGESACPMASFPIIFPNGKVIACIGPPITLPKTNPLYLGNLNDETLSDIFDRAEKNYILHAIRTYGPKVLVNLLQKAGYEHLLPKRYIEEAICDVCYKLLSNNEINDVLHKLIENDSDFKLKVEYGRLYHMNESEMIQD
jgi:organic radical activating enzyme